MVKRLLSKYFNSAANEVYLKRENKLKISIISKLVLKTMVIIDCWSLNFELQPEPIVKLYEDRNLANNKRDQWFHSKNATNNEWHLRSIEQWWSEAEGIITSTSIHLARCAY